MKNRLDKNIGSAPRVAGFAGVVSQPPGAKLLDVNRSKRVLVALFASIWLASPMMLRGSLARPAGVVEKCEGLADKAYPLRMPGNPAAGRVRGTERQFLDYFNKCVKRGDIGASDNAQT